MDETTKLVVRPDTRPEYTRRRACCARDALTRGLADYLRELVLDDEDSAGRDHVRLQVVRDIPSDPNEQSDYPGACVYIPSAASYADEDGSLSGSVLHEFEDGMALWTMTEQTAGITIELWTTNPVERSLFTAAIEDALCPTDWMIGCRLALPHYFGAHAEYRLTNVSWTDDAGNVERDYRRAVFEVDARVPLIRRQRFALLQPVADTSVTGTAD